MHLVHTDVFPLTCKQFKSSFSHKARQGKAKTDTSRFRFVTESVSNEIHNNQARQARELQVIQSRPTSTCMGTRVGCRSNSHNMNVCACPTSTRVDTTYSSTFSIHYAGWSQPNLLQYSTEEEHTSADNPSSTVFLPTKQHRLASTRQQENLWRGCLPHGLSMTDLSRTAPPQP